MVAGVKGELVDSFLAEEGAGCRSVPGRRRADGLYFWFPGGKQKRIVAPSRPQLRCRWPLFQRKYNYLAHQAGQGMAVAMQTAFVFTGIDDSGTLRGSRGPL